MRKRGPFAALLLAALSFGCSAGNDKSSGGTPPLDSSTADGGDSGGLDVGNDASFDVPTDGALPPSCQAVDILFLIDNSPSMGKPQKSLATAFPAFVDAMFDKLPPNVDLHVGITTSSFFVGSCSESTVNCKSAQTAAEISAHYITPDKSNDGENGGQGRLFKYDGKAYFSANTSGDKAALKAWFSAAAPAVGESGCSYEMHSAGAAYTAHPANAATNGGFFRDKGAVLLIIFLADEPDKSPESVATYHDMLTNVKKECGGDKCIITAGLIDPCVKTYDDTMWKFLSSFGEPPIYGDIKNPAEFTTVVGDALALVVKQTCDKITIK